MERVKLLIKSKKSRIDNINYTPLTFIFNLQKLIYLNWRTLTYKLEHKMRKGTKYKLDTLLSTEILPNIFKTSNFEKYIDLFQGTSLKSISCNQNIVK